MNKYLENNLRVIMPSIGMIAVILVAIVLVFNFVFGKITGLLSEYDGAQKMKASLQNKLNTLQTTQTQVSDFAQSLIAALPDANTTLLITSQLKLLASESSLSLQNINVGSEVKDPNGSHVDVIFDLEGPVPSILNFLDQTATVAPINKVTRMKLSSVAGAARASVTVTSYWAALPLKIPAVSDPLIEISPDEQKLLTELMALKQPQFLELTPLSGGGRIDPFGD